MLPRSLQKLIAAFSKLPGVGQKTAQRFAYFLLRTHRSVARDINDALSHIKDEIMLCRECCMISDYSLCPICKNPRRDKHLICVVEHVFDAEAIERSGQYNGVYHILHGRISPLDNVTADDLKIKELVARVRKIAVAPSQAAHAPLEIILATNPSSEGEMTAFYIQKLLKPLNVKLSRIATGIPMGADLEYADEVTLARALKGRQNYD